MILKKERKMSVSRKWIHGVAKRGHTTTVEEINGKKVTKKSYSVWRGMLDRCYDERFQDQYPSYKGCFVCNEWLFYSNFEIWYNKNIPDKANRWELDKDILIQGNKEYSPDTCCFVPQEINSMFTFSNSARGKYPLGVLFSKNKMSFQVSIRKDREVIKKEGFLTAKDAYLWYLEKKKEHIQEKADKAKQEGLISNKVYQAILNFKVEDVDKGRKVQEDDLLPENITLVSPLGEEVTFSRLKEMVERVGSIHQIRSIVNKVPTNTGWSLVGENIIPDIICRFPCGKLAEVLNIEMFCEKYNINTEIAKDCIQGKLLEVEGHTFYKRSRRVREKE